MNTTTYDGHFETVTETSGIQWVTNMKTRERYGPYDIASQNNAGDAVEQMLEIYYMDLDNDE